MNAAPVPSIWRTAAPYGFMLAATVVAFLIVRNYGEGLARTDGVAGRPENASQLRRDQPESAKPQATANDLLHVLVVLLAVIVTGRLLGAVLGRLGQPPVM